MEQNIWAGFGLFGSTENLGVGRKGIPRKVRYF